MNFKFLYSLCGAFFFDSLKAVILQPFLVGEFMLLTPRLKKIADLIPKDSTLADIGTDHAYLPAYCVLNYISPYAIAMDINRGPLNSAAQTVNNYSLTDKIDLRLSDGIAKLNKGETDVIVIAGMGGLLIKNILSKDSSLIKKGTTLILQPMLAQKELREYLYTSENAVTDEYLAREGDKIYNIIVAKSGYNSDYTTEDIVIGRNIKSNSPELYNLYIERNIRILNKIIDGQCKASNRDTDALNTAKAELEMLKKEI